MLSLGDLGLTWQRGGGLLRSHKDSSLELLILGPKNLEFHQLDPPHPSAPFPRPELGRNRGRVSPRNPLSTSPDSLVQALRSPSWQAELALLGAVVPVVTPSRRGLLE